MVSRYALLGLLAILVLVGGWRLGEELQSATGPARGSVSLAFVNVLAPEVSLVSLVFEGRETLPPPIDADGWRVRRPDDVGGGGIFVKSLAALPGRHPVTIEYRLLGLSEAHTATFDITFVAGVWCRLAVRFNEAGTEISACLTTLPTTASGVLH